MDTADAFLAGLASGDAEPALKRDHDSTDDFEHLDRDTRQEAHESPLHAHRAAAQSFLDMERGPSVEPAAEPPAPRPLQPPAPRPLQPVADEHSEVAAERFTDSEPEEAAGEAPLHRPRPPPPRDPTPVLAPTPVSAPATAPAPVSAPATAPAPAPAPAPSPQPPVETKPESKPQPAPPAPPAAPEPVPEPVTAPEKPPAAAAAEPAPAGREPPPPRAPVAHVIEAEVIFCQMGLDAWFDPQRLHPEVESLIYWRCGARSGAALGAGLALLVALACCSVVSVLAYGSLLALSAAVAFRIYKNVLQAVQKTNEGHPFKWLLEKDVSVPAERAQALAAAATAHLNAAVSELRRLFLVEDLVDSLKFGVLLWCLTYVGACFNGITLIILGWIALFTLPKAYEMNKAQVDANLELARAKINEISAKVRAAVPLGRKSDSDKDK